MPSQLSEPCKIAKAHARCTWPCTTTTTTTTATTTDTAPARATRCTWPRCLQRSWSSPSRLPPPFFRHTVPGDHDVDDDGDQGVHVVMMIAMILVKAANSLLSPERTSELVVMKSTVPQEIIQLCISSVFFAMDDQVLVVVTVPCLSRLWCEDYKRRAPSRNTTTGGGTLILDIYWRQVS